MVSLGELSSLGRQFKYGENRPTRLNKLVENVFKININIREIIERYGEIDAYSQGELENKSLKMSSRNMGKNDLWIAATSTVYNLELITTDKDFDHLSDEYLKLKYIDISKYR